MLKYAMKVFLKKLLPVSFIYSYRKIRFVVKSWLFLPQFVKIVANGKQARLSTRGFPTANIALWLGTQDVLDYEPDERALLEPFFKSARCFWDIGAQVGFYSIVAALHGVPEILAVDIDERYCEEIKRHAKANNLNIHVHKAATGLSGTEVTFENFGATSTQMAVSLDDLVKLTCQKPDLIKIDIDGGEIATLTGAPQLFQSADGPILLIEFLAQHNNTSELKTILERYGYRMVKKAGNNTLWLK